jgi:GT2 family glycosyltransferase
MIFLTLTWNNFNRLNKLKESLVPLLKGDDLWLIKDNASKDNTVEKIIEWNNKNIKVIAYKDNTHNFSQGMNYLFNEASPKDNDDIMLLNDDVVFNDDKSIKLMQTILNKKNVGVVGARLCYLNSNILQHAGVVFNEKCRSPEHFRLNEVSDFNAEKNRLFQVVTGAVLLTKAEYFKNVFVNKSGNKGMDENYHWAFDDVDFCLSIKYNMKKDIVYCGKTDIFHEESSSLKKNPVNHLFLNHNLNYLRNKWNNKVIYDKEQYISNTNCRLFRE